MKLSPYSFSYFCQNFYSRHLGIWWHSLYWPFFYNRDL